MASNQEMEAGPTRGLPSQNASYHQSGRGSNVGLLLVLGSGQYLQLCCRELCSQGAPMMQGLSLCQTKGGLIPEICVIFFFCPMSLVTFAGVRYGMETKGVPKEVFPKKQDTKDLFQFFSEFMISVGDAMLGELSPKAKQSNFIASNMSGACSIAGELRQCVSSKQEDFQGRQNCWLDEI